MSSALVRGERPALTGWERGLRWFGLVLALISLGFAASYLYRGVFADAEFPFAVNSVAKDVLLAAVCLLLVWDVRRWSPVAVPFIVGIHVVMPVALVLTLNGGAEGIQATAGGLVDPEVLRWSWFGIDLVVVAFAVVLYRKAARSRYDMRYLTPSGFRALMALAEVLVLREDRTIAPAEVAVRVDHYLDSFKAREKYRIRLAFTALAFLPLATLHPPFNLMSIERRERWIERRFLDDTRDWLVPKWARDLRRALIRTAQQFCFFGYYGDERAAAEVGYIPFSRREDTPDRLSARVRPARKLTSMTPSDVNGESITADVVVVGTGAGGATLAYELARRNREVLMLERGRHFDPAGFTENEAVQLANLYADGALTLSKDFRFQVAQGMCVGGSTVVNNAVCFDLPDHVLDRWLERDGLDAGLDAAGLRHAFGHVRDFLKVGPIDAGVIRNPGGERIAHAINRLHKQGRFGGTMRVVECNIADCVGCGYCNLGCSFGAKLSALDHTLPIAQRRYKDAIRILPECHVDKVVSVGGRPRVHARLGDGRRLTVRAETVVLSAGAIASSVILQRSGLGGDQVGRSLSFNMASPVTVEFRDKVHSERGIQISHYFEPSTPGDLDMTVETWFNPVVAQSLFMPGWFDEHRRNMRRYAYMTSLGAVVGTASNGSVRARRGNGFRLDYEPQDRDFVRLKKGVRLACEIGLEAGAVQVLPTTLRTVRVSAPEKLSLIDTEIGETNDLSVNSAHPQGGNPISRDAKKGVVGPDFHVYGTDNVYVCDASVFPSSITVNPQLTVMALAAYAADEIAGELPAQLGGSITQASA
jgi:choline dehydrogenase-like flavoprotein